LCTGIAENSIMAETGLEFLQILLENTEVLKSSQLTMDTIVELKDSITNAASTSRRIKRNVDLVSLK